MKDNRIYVTKPKLPPLEEFIPSLEKIWENRILTNGGPFHQQFEEELAAHLGVPYVSLFSNGTLALMTALQALRVTGEVITTPYTFVATSNALLWNGLKPVFADVDPQTLNLSPKAIEAAITPETTAILPVHCYGQPCDVEAIQKIADDYNLNVIYDAAHAFGVNTPKGSVLNYGDLSILSLHATKVFNTFEGGAIVCKDIKTKTRIDRLKNFGFVDETTVVTHGINGKMNEFSAALGLLQLKYIDSMIEARQTVDALYREKLAGIPGISCITGDGEGRHNYSYFPILVGPEYGIDRDALYELLSENGIHARRYFHPLVSSFPMYRNLPSAREDNLQVALKAASEVLCLPIYPDLETTTISTITDIIARGSTAA
ncbi:DegT/DnrJ/EryC1/StrS aminotransferase family protein [Rhizobium sp. L1K21]|uniref:DegT/DnrJ/EryC1/StrS family aminotransferase n=1 Tax=Rhizobium sp. L1K21 TaxID=2954933 RepID=UPI002093A467|nr:DegT/DnrJ/EryC1/StrS family aminotransferase [Rhizobium sp. L1K21]MCO6188384.1 DegT/DnrJ/EryC1/StrS family aminotransferase [Rhizobium sp. L1K21]